MNFDVTQLPERDSKTRRHGITMVMDTGLSIRQAEDMIETSRDYIDFIKLGFGTSYVTQNLKSKLDVYRKNNIPTYFGGTLFEVMYVRGATEEYKKILNQYKIEYVEISDGSMTIEHDIKCELIREFSKDFKVISEVGSKDTEDIIPPYLWIELMEKEKEAGSCKLIAEARESGNVGIYRSTGEVRQGLVKEIVTKIPEEDIIWEAPKKEQQVWFIKIFGANVNLGNIRPDNVLALETVRLGLRGDSFDFFRDTKNA